ncbi:hypothetical protein AAMO2058_000710800 [Amorphochlora amoebiformis]
MSSAGSRGDFASWGTGGLQATFAIEKVSPMVSISITTSETTETRVRAMLDTGSDLILLPIKKNQLSREAESIGVALASVFMDGETRKEQFFTTPIRFDPSPSHTLEIQPQLTQPNPDIVYYDFRSSHERKRGNTHRKSSKHSQKSGKRQKYWGKISEDRQESKVRVPVGVEGGGSRRRGIVGLAPVKDGACSEAQRIGFLNNAFDTLQGNKILYMDLSSGIGSTGHLQISSGPPPLPPSSSLEISGDLVCPPSLATGRCNDPNPGDPRFSRLHEEGEGGCGIYDIRKEEGVKVLFGRGVGRLCSCGFLAGGTGHYLMHVQSSDIPGWSHANGGGYLMIDTGTTYSALPFGRSIVIGDKNVGIQPFSESTELKGSTWTLTLDHVMDLGGIMEEPPAPSPLNMGRFGIMGYRDLVGRILVFDLDKGKFQMWK